MAAVNVLNVTVLSNPAPFLDNLSFEITFECVTPLPDDLEWKVVYVGSARTSEYDQELESVIVGPVPVGTSRFVLETRAPDPAKIPAEDLLGATIVMITCLYQGKKFARVGYWVSNAYPTELAEGELPTPKLITRNILSDKPRVTKWPILWG